MRPNNDITAAVIIQSVSFSVTVDNYQWFWGAVPIFNLAPHPCGSVITILAFQHSSVTHLLLTLLLVVSEALLATSTVEPW